jgi:hypothetical protein
MNLGDHLSLFRFREAYGRRCRDVRARLAHILRGRLIGVNRFSCVYTRES